MKIGDKVWYNTRSVPGKWKAIITGFGEKDGYAIVDVDIKLADATGRDFFTSEEKDRGLIGKWGYEDQVTPRY